VPPPYELPNDAASPRRTASATTSKRGHASVLPSPASGWTPNPHRGTRGDSEVLAGLAGGYYLAVELEAPSEASLRERASPESESSGWTDRQARGATMPMPWI
jgi:hypothetical protein